MTTPIYLMRLIRRVVPAVLLMALVDFSAPLMAEEPRDRPTTRQNDPRLPPVIPGEVVVTESGDKIKVWSSSGPVPVQATPVGNGIGDVDVVVDSRDRPERRPGHGHHGIPGGEVRELGHSGSR